MEEEKVKLLEVALWESDPWKQTSEFEFVCLHCGSKFNGGVPADTHKQDCIWLVNYLEVEGWLTQDAADLLQRPACCASFVAFGVHHKDCRMAQTASG